MRVSEFGGEQALIRLIAEKYGAHPDSSLVKPIGDDAAVILVGGDAIIVTCDMLIENTHFRRDIIEAYEIGWKSVAVNISDIAAMGGTPTYTLISIGIDDQEVALIDESYRGIRDAASQFGSKLIGGDTCFSDSRLIFSVFQLGTAEPERVLYRSGARSGDVVMVTGTLGDSRVGLELLLKHGLTEARMRNEEAVKAHLRPVPRVNEGRLLAKLGIHAAMDLSDGLASDLPKLCEAGGVGAVVYLDSIPVGDSTRKLASEFGHDPARFAVEGGEDYELLFTVAPDGVEPVKSALMDNGLTPATEIGVITDDGKTLLVSSDGSTEPLFGGWRHFPGDLMDA